MYTLTRLRGADDDHDLRARCSLDPPAGRRGGAADARRDLPPTPRGRRPGGGRRGDPRRTAWCTCTPPRPGRATCSSTGGTSPRWSSPAASAPSATSTRPACSSRRRSSTPTSTPSTRCSCPARSPGSSSPRDDDGARRPGVHRQRARRRAAWTSSPPRRTPMRIFAQVTPDVPRRGRDGLNGAHVTQAEILDRVTRPDAVSARRVQPVQLLDDEMAEALSVAIGAGKRATGHTARLLGEPLWAYAAGGVGDDHNAATLDEVHRAAPPGDDRHAASGVDERLLRGDPRPARTCSGSIGAHLAFCADDKHVEDLARPGRTSTTTSARPSRSAWRPELAIRMGVAERRGPLPHRPPRRVAHAEPARRPPAARRPRDVPSRRRCGSTASRSPATAPPRSPTPTRCPTGVARHDAPGPRHRGSTCAPSAAAGVDLRSCRRWRCTTATTSGRSTSRSTSSTGPSCRTRRTTSPRSASSTATTRRARPASGSSEGSACAAARSPRRPTATTRTS